MRNEGTRAAQTAANIRLWSKWLCDCMNVCPGCAWSSRLPSVSIKQSDKKTSVHPSVEKKTQAWARVSGGWCRRWNADFEACSAHFAWILIIGALRSHRKCRILAYAGPEAETRRLDERRQNLLERCTQKVLRATFGMMILCFLLERIWSARGF